MAKNDVDDTFAALDYHSRTIIERVQIAARSGKGVRLNSFDCHVLAQTIFLEDAFMGWEECDEIKLHGGRSW